MLSDRDYMRADGNYPKSRKGWGISTGWTAFGWLLASLLGIFCLQAVSTYWFGIGGALESFLGLRPDRLFSGYIWMPVTYAFLHDASMPWHILGNLLVIFFFGRPFHQDFGDRVFLKVFFVAVLAGAAFWLPFHFGQPALLIGASAGAIAFFTIFCLRRYEEPITFMLWFVVPVRVKPKFLLFFTLFIEGFFFLFNELSVVGSPVAHSAHLGGMFIGWYYFHSIVVGDFGRNGTASWLGRWFSRHRNRPAFTTTTGDRGRAEAIAQVQKYTSPPTGKVKVNITNQKDIRKEIDRILDKINEQGFGSLTDEEKQILDNAGELLSKR